jgi:hypothetical protein
MGKIMKIRKKQEWFFYLCNSKGCVGFGIKECILPENTKMYRELVKTSVGSEFDSYGYEVVDNNNREWVENLLLSNKLKRIKDL